MNNAEAHLMTVFSAALDCGSADERQAYLDRTCAEDPALRERVEALLRAHERAGGFLGPPGPEETAALEAETMVAGRYKLLQVIGEGGMGTVSMAEQTQPVRRTVALKVIRPGMDSRQVLARFEAERQALALMDHPNIARVLDAGTTETGRPYFVMELVKGVPITRFCDDRRLTPRERLELFIPVCEAVQHAHQKGVIHRDLKPSNVLIALYDGKPVPKVIDFGVAKATGPRLTDRTLYTEFGSIVGTLEYMSPEQAELNQLDIDTRSDIYSLGVLLYELLTGTTPLERARLKEAALLEVMRVIREEEPPRPSTRLSTTLELPSIAACRGTEPRKLSGLVRGELDWIVMKALEKDRNRRYETANAFAADVMRYLTDRPVEACPPSRWYRFTKYAHRHRVGIAATAAVALALAAGTAVSAWQAALARKAAAEARKAAAEARARADESQQVIDFLARDVFSLAAAGQGQGRALTLGEALDRADASLTQRFRRQPLVEASIRLVLHESYHRLGDVKRALRQAARAAELRAERLGDSHPATLQALSQQAAELNSLGFSDTEAARAAERIYRRVLASSRRVLGASHPETLNVQRLLAKTVSHLGRQEEAEAILAEAEQIAGHSLGPEHWLTVSMWETRALVLQRKGDLDRAEALSRQALAFYERTQGRLSSRTLDNLERLASIVEMAGRGDDALRLYVDLIDRYIQTGGFPHPRTAFPLSGVQRILRARGDYASIRDLWERWLGKLLATPAGGDPHLRSRRSIRLSSMALELASLPEPIPFDASLAVRAAEEAVAVDGDWDGGLSCLAGVYYHLGRLDEAMRTIQTKTARSRGKGGDDLDWLVLALIHARRGEMDPARICYEKVGNRSDRVDDLSTSKQLLREEVEALLGINPSQVKSR